MSSKSEEWARSIKGRTIAQRDLLLAMAKRADDSGFLGPLTDEIAKDGGMTLREAVKTAEGLLRLGYCRKAYDMDKYVWVWRLLVKP
jgi:hypothetical protein